MSTPQQTSKKSQKRKSTAAENDAELEIIVGEASTSAGPAFVNFPSVKPHKSTPFTMYAREDESSHLDITKQNTLVAGETEDVEFFSLNRDHARYDESQNCQYVAALYDPSSNTLHINPSTPLYLMHNRAKRLREANIAGLDSELSRGEYRARRNDLGEMFGTRKAKTQIRAQERNKVDVSAMQGVKGHLMDSIGANTDVVSTGPVAASDLIPVPNLETDMPSEVYIRDSLIPPSEWSTIDISQVLAASDDKGRSGALPYRRSRWIEQKMRVTIEGPSTIKKTNLKMLYYLSCLLQLSDIAIRIPRLSPAEIAGKFPGVSSQVVNGMLSRFAEQTGKKYTVTEKMKTKLLLFICTLYLAVDGWTTDVGRVAKDLSITPGKVGDMFKSLGCIVEVASVAEREKLGITLAEAQKNKKAILKAPVKFPKVKMRGPVKR